MLCVGQARFDAGLALYDQLYARRGDHTRFMFSYRHSCGDGHYLSGGTDAVCVLRSPDAALPLVA